MSKKPLIVGVDPGNTSAIAGFNLEGELEFLESQKDFATDQIIQELVKKGLPVVIACDKKKMPSKVSKIAQSLGAKKFKPEEDLKSQRKEELGDGENSHEVDAYASGIYAYNNLKNSIRKIKRDTKETEKTEKELAKEYFMH